MTLADEKARLQEVIKGSEAAWEWLSKMQDVQRRLVQDAGANKGASVDLTTKQITGSWVRVTFNAQLNSTKLATDIMEQYEWDDSGLSASHDPSYDWELYLSRKFQIA